MDVRGGGAHPVYANDGFHLLIKFNCYLKKRLIRRYNFSFGKCFMTIDNFHRCSIIIVRLVFHV